MANTRKEDGAPSYGEPVRTVVNRANWRANGGTAHGTLMGPYHGVVNVNNDNCEK